MAVNTRTLRLLDGLRDQVEQITDDQVRFLVGAWVDGWNEVEPDLRAALLEQLVAGENVTRSQLMRSVRLRNSLQVIAGNLRQLATATDVRLTGDLQAVIDLTGAAQASIIDSQIPAGFIRAAELTSWTRVDPLQIAAIVKRSTEQITSRTRELSAEAYDAVRRELIRGVASGSNPRQTADRIIQRAQRRFNGGLTRALTIALTETLSAHREAARVAQEQHSDVLTGWRWMCSLSVRTCPGCLSKNGTLHDLSEPGPYGHQNCRCSRVPVTKSWADLGIRADEPPDLFPDARAWFDSLSEPEQVAVMGRARLRLIVDGEIGWDDLATLKKTTGWRDSWVPTPVKTLRRSRAA